MRRLLCVVLVVLVVGGMMAGSTASSADVFAEEGREARVTRFLLLGCDRSSRLTDTILLVTLNETARKASILQIPRDTYAAYTQKDYKKLNGAMNALGVSGVKAFLSDALGVPIDYFFVLKLDVFAALVDAIGGVEVDVPQDMTYSDPAQGLDISLTKGRQHLDGKQAEQFVRYRSGYVNADLGRLDAQKLFLRAFAKQCRSLSVSQLLRVLLLALTNVQTDIGLQDAIRVLGVLRACDDEELPMATLAGKAVQGNSGAWYYVLNKRGACRMINAYALPAVPITVEEFDPHGVFDRLDHRVFHNIYQAAEEELPHTDPERKDIPNYG